MIKKILQLKINTDFAVPTPTPSAKLHLKNVILSPIMTGVISMILQDYMMRENFMILIINKLTPIVLNKMI